MKALVTGGRGGIGSAICALLDDPLVLDLPEFDVGDPEAWHALDGEFDAAFLNAGIGIGYADVAELPDAEWQRILRANLDGVVYGTRELAARLMPNGGSIVATASLAGLTDMPHDPSYSATKAGSMSGTSRMSRSSGVTMLVSAKPGQIALILIPCAARPGAEARTQPMTAAFVAL